ncbi:acetoacetate--CoA ligase [Desulfovirgula thermocuniculi]|uniref:acetoacetate--CoA ligase n=1 Tax=Desulfovirgula thermocuniculi TaxID=348842 RepID=UPI000555BDFC|nr:acetoacetate--CoA ligase [Desulfovirgula thermocuniculi]
MKKKPLWVPSPERVREANMTRFTAFVNERYNLHLRDYFDLYRWSVENIPDFWAAMWDYGGIVASAGYTAVVDDLSKFPGARWFPGARLNFAENLLRYRDDHTALIFRGEGGRRKTMTYRELYDTVGRLARALREAGVGPGDRVVAYMPNLIETAVAMLAATSIGAIWSSCATDIGPQAALDRLGQVEPKVMFTVDGYVYKGRHFSTLANAAEVARHIPSLEKVVVVPFISAVPDVKGIPGAVLWDDFLAPGPVPPEFVQLPFDHPVYIMFSSGTTGKPKCMVQGAGGVLINHLKELLLHTDLKRADRIMYITTCSWMMWNWLLSSLAVGATVVLYDGNPNHPDAGAMWRLIEEEKVTIFGCSATYINYLRSQGFSPGKEYDLSSLREISQTGSPLSAEGFAYVYREIKEDLHFNSISGGTDINGCFAAGSPTLPVYAGELQAPALAMKIKAYDEEGRPVWDRQGELVCEAPAPSMPLYFWNDPEGEKYRSAYFSHYPGVWRHGDYIVMHSDTGGITFYGRSDAVLKPSGVRIGTAEIYNVVEKLPEVADSLAVGQNWQGDQRVILFVKLAEGYRLTKELEEKIKRALREQASPRHVPHRIIAVPDIPYTMNMKKVESAVANIINGRPVTNRDALVNPESLAFFEQILPELQQA